jgi:4-diphosphocytidyl-2-C-methyl-D-erythritol kinase
MQTIDLCDTITLHEANDITLELSGDASLLAGEPPERNLAYRGAEALRAHAGLSRGVRIELEKRIPVAAGLGGGSSDAAAVLRGCNALWDLALSDDELMSIAATIGSDVPFFIVGGTASVSGRGEIVQPLPDVNRFDFLLATPPDEARGDKTAAMYAALSPDDFTDGEATDALEEAIRAGHHLVDDGMLYNVFERVLPRTQPALERLMRALTVNEMPAHLSGSGPSYFLITISARYGKLAPHKFRRVEALTRARALRIEEL